MHHDYTKGKIMYLHMDSEDIVSKPDQLCLALLMKELGISVENFKNGVLLLHF